MVQWKNSQLRLIYNEEYQLVQSEFGVPYQLKSKKIEQLHEDAWLSHVHDGWVYYSKAHLFRMKLDGKERQQLTTGDRTDGDSVGFIVNDWIVFNRIYGFQPMSSFQMKSDGSQQKARELGDVLYK